MRCPAPLVPEFDVHDLAASLRFYVGVIGFVVTFEPTGERFAYLGLGGAEVMLQDASGPGRRFRTAPLEHPFGRGINLQIEVPNVDETFGGVRAAGIEPLIEIEERWYEVNVVTPSGRWSERGVMDTGNRQFVVADPDGYLLRLHEPRVATDLTAIRRQDGPARSGSARAVRWSRRS